MSSQCPAGPRSLIHQDRLLWQRHRRVYLAPSSPGRGLTHRCSEWPDEENKHSMKEDAYRKFSQNKRNLQHQIHIGIFITELVHFCFLDVLTVSSGGFFQSKATLLFYSCFPLTYWKLESPFLVQPMRYRATSGAPCSQVALKLVWVTSENRRFFGAGTTSTEYRGRRLWAGKQRQSSYFVSHNKSDYFQSYQ